MFYCKGSIHGARVYDIIHSYQSGDKKQGNTCGLKVNLKESIFFQGSF